MKVVAINGSPREKGNTSILVGYVFEELKKKGIQTELIQLGGKLVHGCDACTSCFETRDETCILKDDLINDCLAKMKEADGIILASPTYVTDVTSEMKALIDRGTMVARANPEMLRRKVGAAVVSVRRAGGIHAFDTINHFFTINEMIIPGSTYWNIGIGRDIGQVESDEEGIRTMKTLGENMAWLLQKLKG